MKPKDKIQPGIVYEKLQGTISCWDKCDSDRFYDEYLEKFLEQGRMTILTKNKIVLNPVLNPKPWHSDDVLNKFASRISIIVLPKSKSIDIQE